MKFPSSPRWLAYYVKPGLPRGALRSQQTLRPWERPLGVRLLSWPPRTLGQCGPSAGGVLARGQDCHLLLSRSQLQDWGHLSHTSVLVGTQSSSCCCLLILSHQGSQWRPDLPPCAVAVSPKLSPISLLPQTCIHSAHSYEGESSSQPHLPTVGLLRGAHRIIPDTSCSCSAMVTRAISGAALGPRHTLTSTSKVQTPSFLPAQTFTCSWVSLASEQCGALSTPTPARLTRGSSGPLPCSP